MGDKGHHSDYPGTGRTSHTYGPNLLELFFRVEESSQTLFRHAIEGHRRRVTLSISVIQTRRVLPIPCSYIAFLGHVCLRIGDVLTFSLSESTRNFLHKVPRFQSKAFPLDSLWTFCPECNLLNLDVVPAELTPHHGHNVIHPISASPFASRPGSLPRTQRSLFETAARHFRFQLATLLVFNYL
jgi:hypothetical protein